MRKSLMVVAVMALLAMASLVFAAGYSDVPANSIYAPAIEALTKAKIMVGSNGLFNGSTTVNRYQLAETAYKLLNYLENDPLLAKAKDISTLQAVVNSVVKKMGSNDVLIANLQKEVNSLKVVVNELQNSSVAQVVAQNTQSINTLQNMLVQMQDMISQASQASAKAEKALKLTHINNTMIANQAKELASLKQEIKGLQNNSQANANAKEISTLKSQIKSLNKTVSDNYIALSTSVSSVRSSLSNQISFVNNDLKTTKSNVEALSKTVKSLNKTVSDNYIALNTSISSVQSSLSNQINFVGNDLKVTKSQLSSEISNTKVALEQEIAKTDAKANLALWTGIAGIAVGAIGFGTFLYWVWEQQ